MNSLYSGQSKWALLAALMMIATFAKSQIALQDYNNVTGYAAASSTNQFADYRAGRAEYFGSMKYSYGRRKGRQHVWGYVCGAGFGVGFIALAVVDPGDVAIAIVAGLAGANPPTNSNPVKPPYLTNSQYNNWNLIMAGGMSLGILGALMGIRSEHRYALGGKTSYMNRLCYTRQGYPRFRVAGSGNQIGLGISLY